MKRDWDIIRAVLLALESAPTANTQVIPATLPEFDDQQVAYNMRLLHEAGYVDARFMNSSAGDGRITLAIVTRMTNSGHELLDTIRNESVWLKIKDQVMSKGLDLTFDVVKLVGKQIIEAWLSS